MTGRSATALRWAGLALLFVKELLLSAWQTARLILSPRRDWRPAIVAVPVDLRGDAAITLLADMVTLTPGTTILHVSEDRRTLYVHVMDAAAPEATAHAIKSGFERKIREVLP